MGYLLPMTYYPLPMTFHDVMCFRLIVLIKWSQKQSGAILSIKPLVFFQADGYVNLAGIFETPECGNHAQNAAHDKFLYKRLHG